MGRVFPILHWSKDFCFMLCFCSCIYFHSCTLSGHQYPVCIYKYLSLINMVCPLVEVMWYSNGSILCEWTTKSDFASSWLHSNTASSFSFSLYITLLYGGYVGNGWGELCKRIQILLWGVKIVFIFSVGSTPGTHSRVTNLERCCLHCFICICAFHC